jgi:hypothetical protein
VSEAVERWIAESYTRFASDYAGGLTNHLPMAVIAMCELGADDARIEAFAQTYVTRLEPAVPGELEEARALASRIEREVSVNVMRPLSLEHGVAGAAFHGIIGMAYACHQPDPVELGRAIAYAARVSMPLPIPDPSPSTLDVGALAERLRMRGLPRPKGHTIADRVQRVARDPAFQQIARLLAADESTAARVALLGARAYLAKDDFASLHVVTGATAFGMLRGIFADDAAGDHALGVAALACYVTSGSPELGPEAPDLPVDPWDEIAARAILSDDDHVAKLVLSCRTQAEATGQPIFQAIATKVSRRGSS